jgi:hypothetical protein
MEECQLLEDDLRYLYNTLEDASDELKIRVALALLESTTAVVACPHADPTHALRIWLEENATPRR